MTAHRAIVLVIDRLGAGWLGPYGNTWLDTPNFNRLAAQSRLYETAIADSPSLAVTYRAYWSGRHAQMPPRAHQQSLPELATARGTSALLITDDQEVAAHPLAASFAECQLLQRPATSSSALATEETWLYAIFQAAAQAVRDASTSGLVWIHTSGLGGAWDARLEMRDRFADDDDPQPPRIVDPPDRLLAANYDPDELLGISQAYAGQVALLDECLGLLLDALDEHPLAAHTLFAVTSPRGYPLGEHLRVGKCDEALYGELLHVPLFLRLPESSSPERIHAIVQPHELFRWISEGHSGQDLPRAMTAAYSIGQEQRSIRTLAWFLRQSRRDGDWHNELFAKPDDRWEANEVSSLCGPIVEPLAARMDEFERAAESDQLAELPPLAETLVDTWR